MVDSIQCYRFVLETLVAAVVLAAVRLDIRPTSCPVQVAGLLVEVELERLQLGRPGLLWPKGSFQQ